MFPPVSTARETDRHARILVRRLGKHAVSGPEKLDIVELRHLYDLPHGRSLYHKIPQDRRHPAVCKPAQDAVFGACLPVRGAGLLSPPFLGRGTLLRPEIGDILWKLPGHVRNPRLPHQKRFPIINFGRFDPHWATAPIHL